MLSIPPLVRVNIRDNKVIAINLSNVSSLALEKQAALTRPKPGATASGELEPYTADVLRVYFPSGTGLKFEVGANITQEEFDYACAAIGELLYLTTGERAEIARQQEQAKIR